MSTARDLEAAGLLAGLDEPAVREARLELLTELQREGVSIEEQQRATLDGRLALLRIDRVLNHELPTLSAIDIAKASGLDLDLLRTLWRALGFAEAEDNEVAFTEKDLEAARTVAQFHAAGLEEQHLVLISQVLGQGMAGLGETLREIVGEALLQAGDNERALGLRYAQAAEYMIPMLTPLLAYVLGVHLKEQIKTDVIYQEELVSGRLIGAREITVCFADLVGFTALGERVEPTALGSAGRWLTEMAVEVARPPVRLVKTIGDAVMLVSHEPEPLLEAALDLIALAEDRGEARPRLRIGVASGQAVPQSGDWFGAPVNLASRITEVARTMSVLTTKSVRDAVQGAFSWSFAGRHRLKGVRGEVPLYRVRRENRAAL